MHTKKNILFVAALLVTAGFATGRAQDAKSTPPAATDGSSNDQPLTLNAFKVENDRDTGYRKLSTVTTSRIGIPLTEAPQAIEIISGEMLHDLDLNSIRDAFDYSSSITANKQEVLQGPSFKLRGFGLPTYINGLAQAPSPSNPGYISTDNVDRIEVAKGPVGLFFGNSSPNGVANIITKRPEFVNRTKVELSAGSYGYEKAIVDTQAVVSKEYGIAYRLITSANKSETRIGQDTSYRMTAGSVSIRPNDKIQVQVEFDATTFQNSYPSNNAWNFMVNPLYYQQVKNPPQQMINYVKTKYGAADDAAALAIINTRWGSAGPTSFLANWTADYFGAYGKIAYPETGTTMNWGAISPLGDKFTGAGPDSNDDGTTYLADASVTLTPFEHTAIQYHWIHNANRQNFDRQLFGYNSGPLDALGHMPSLTIGASVGQRDSDSDTQQLDFSQEVSFAGVKNRFVAGVESYRDSTNSGTALIDPSRAPTQPLPGGGTESGILSTQFYYPFSQSLYPLSTTVAGPIIKVRTTPDEYQSWYASYRGSVLNDKINLLAGVRDVKLLTSGSTAYGEDQLTKTFGAIGEVLPGLFLFGSYNTDFIFSNGYTVNYVSNGLPVPGEGTALGSETGKGFEAGVKLALFDDKLSGTVSYFKIERDGVATSNIAKNSSDPRNLDKDPNNDVRFNLNGGLQRTSGVDADLIWTPTRELQVLSNITYMPEARILSDPSINTTDINITENNARLYDKEFNHRLAKSPSFASNLLLKYNFQTGALRGLYLGAGVRYEGKYMLSDNFNYDIYVNAETKFDAFAGYGIKVFKIPATLHLNLQNIGNVINDVTRDDGFVVSARIGFQF